MATLDDTDVTVANVLTRYLRLQQIASNYWPSSMFMMPCPSCRGVGCARCRGLGYEEHEREAQRITEDNPRLDALRQELHGDRQTTVWVRFQQDAQDVMELCRIEGIPAARYDGTTSQADKVAALASYKRAEVQVLVASPRAAGRGLTLDNTSVVINYSHYFSLLLRQQADARSVGARNTVSYVDLIAVDTVDEIIVDALLRKKSLSDLITEKAKIL